MLETFRMLAAIPHESLGAYVITMAQQASDVLAVVLLQKDAQVPRRCEWCRSSRRQPTCERAPDTSIACSASRCTGHASTDVRK